MEEHPFRNVLETSNWQFFLPGNTTKNWHTKKWHNSGNLWDIKMCQFLEPDCISNFQENGSPGLSKEQFDEMYLYLFKEQFANLFPDQAGQKRAIPILPDINGGYGSSGYGSSSYGKRYKNMKMRP